MKRLKVIFLVLLCAFLFAACNEESEEKEEEGTKPYAELTVEEIESVSLEYFRGGRSSFYDLNETQTEKFVKILNEFVIYDEVERWNEANGGSDIYTITKKDGSETVLILIGDYMGIDGIGYSIKKSFRDRLSSFSERIAEGYL